MGYISLNTFNKWTSNAAYKNVLYVYVQRRYNGKINGNNQIKAAKNENGTKANCSVAKRKTSLFQNGCDRVARFFPVFLSTRRFTVFSLSSLGNRCIKST